MGIVPYKAMLNEPAPLVVAVEAAAGRAAGTPWESLMAVVRILVTLVSVLAPLSALVSFGLMLSLPWTTWERLVLWMTIGVVVYFGYGYRRSRLRAPGLATRPT